MYYQKSSRDTSARDTLQHFYSQNIYKGLLENNKTGAGKVRKQLSSKVLFIMFNVVITSLYPLVITSENR